MTQTSSHTPSTAPAPAPAPAPVPTTAAAVAVGGATVVPTKATSFSSYSSSSSSSQQQQQQQQQKQQQVDNSCSSCVKLVHSILQDVHSRPRQVLEALVGGPATNSTTTNISSSSSSNSSSSDTGPTFQVVPAMDGVYVKMRIPEIPTIEMKTWRHIEPPPPPPPEVEAVLLENDPFDNDNNRTRRSLFFSNNNSNNNDTKNKKPLATSVSHQHSFLTSDPDLSKIDTAVAQQQQQQQQSTSNSTTTTSTKFITKIIKIECRPCDTTGPEQGARALIMGPDPLSIVACTNRLERNNRQEMNEILTHELLHAYDVSKLRLEFRDCESAAYSEVRAAREAECYVATNTNTSSTSTSSSASNKARRFLLQSPKFLTDFCIKQKAIAATQNVFPTQGRTCVTKVMNAAMADPRPFSSADLLQWKIRLQQQQQQQQTENNNNNNNNQNDFTNDGK